MGILGTTGTVLTQFKADTKHHRKELKKLQGAERERHKKLISSLEEQNDKLDRGIGRLGKVAVAVGTVTAAYMALKKGADFYLERQQAMAAGAGKALQGMREASMGLMTDTRLLNIEATLLNGSVKLNNEEMDKAVKFMFALRKEGNDLAEVEQEVTRAFVELNTEGLKKFGVNIQAATGSADAFQKLLKEADKHIDAFGGSLGIKGDNVTRTMTNLANATDDLKLAWGSFANKVLPTLIGWLNKVLQGFVKISNVVRFLDRKADRLFMSKKTAQFHRADPKKRISLAVTGRLEGQTRYGQLSEVMAGQVNPAAAQSIINNADSVVANLLDDGIDPRDFARNTLDKLYKGKFITRQQGRAWYRRVETMWGAWNKMARKAGVKTHAQEIRIQEETRKAEERAAAKLRKKQLAGLYKPKGSKAKAKRGVAFDSDISALGLGYDNLGLMGPDINAQLALGLTGPPEEFTDSTTRQMTRMTDMAGTFRGVFDQMTVGVGEAFGAWIAGTESFTSAFNRMMQNTLTGLAIEQAVESMKHAALAIGNMAFGNKAGAALHWKASAMHAGVAAAAGVGARTFGGLTGGGKTAPNTVGGVSGGGGGGTRNQTIILGADFETDSSRRRSHRLATMLNNANRTGAGATVVEWE